MVTQSGPALAKMMGQGTATAREPMLLVTRGRTRTICLLVNASLCPTVVFSYCSPRSTCMDLFSWTSRNDAVFSIARPPPSTGAFERPNVETPDPVPDNAGEPGLFWERRIAEFLTDRQARLASLFAKATGGPLTRDLLFHLPTDYTDRRRRVLLADAPIGAISTVKVEVMRIDIPAKKTAPAIVIVRDSSGFADIVLFAHYAARAYSPGATMVISGEVERRGGRISITHPHHALPVERAAELPWVEPVWLLTSGLTRSAMWGTFQKVLRDLPRVNEWVHPAVVKRNGWPGFREALRNLHAPSEPPTPASRQRLAYDEAFARALSTTILREEIQSRPGVSMRGNGSLRDEALSRFGYPLTEAQAVAVGEIISDMQSDQRMLRLLQGDVGSGKTMVGLMAMLNAVEAGYQAAMLAPTEILAKQHYAKIKDLTPASTVLLIGGLSAGARRRTLQAIASGEAKLIIGTHSLIQKNVEYHRLGLAVIDEQHRFGVDHRVALADKGDNVDTLVMTATPIPRTVLLSNMGWMRTSLLKGKPRGRKPIRTTAHPVSRLPELYESIGTMIRGGGRVYWVCPLVNENENIDLAAAVARYDELHTRFGDQVAIAHGQQSAADRDKALAEFASGAKTILVSTTVVEVGVDVPEASVMVVEHAERFGAAQLHQLRGRVGRGDAASFCLLLHADDIGFHAQKRINLLKRTNDGFEIAEEDFLLRGGGDMLGKRQTGQTAWRVVVHEEHHDLVGMAQRDAAHLLSQDPNLTSDRGKAARMCMTIFGVDDALRYSASG